MTLSACNFLPYIPPPAPTTTTTTVPHTGTMFDEQFNGASLDTTKWTAMNRPGDASNAEVGCYKPSNVTQSAGFTRHSHRGRHLVPRLQLHVGHDPDHVVQVPRTARSSSAPSSRAAPDRGPRCGCSARTVRRRTSRRRDNIPPCNWPQPGSDEIDIAEIVAGNKGNVNEFVFMANGSGGCSTTTTDTSLNWHTYQLVWAPGRLTWKIDGATTCTETAHVPSTPMFLIINTAVGGAGGGTVAPSTLPQFTNVDYITVNRVTSASPLSRCS